MVPIGKPEVTLGRQVRGLTSHRFYPKDGEDLYWYQNNAIFPQVRAFVVIRKTQIDVSDQVGTKPGKELREDEPLFEVQPLKD